MVTAAAVVLCGLATAGSDPWMDEEPGTRVRLVPGDEEIIPADGSNGTLEDLAVGSDGTPVLIVAEDDASSEVLRRSMDGAVGDGFRPGR